MYFLAPPPGGIWKYINDANEFTYQLFGVSHFISAHKILISQQVQPLHLHKANPFVFVAFADNGYDSDNGNQIPSHSFHFERMVMIRVAFSNKLDPSISAILGRASFIYPGWLYCSQLVTTSGQLWFSACESSNKHEAIRLQRTPESRTQNPNPMRMHPLSPVRPRHLQITAGRVCARLDQWWRWQRRRSPSRRFVGRNAGLRQSIVRDLVRRVFSSFEFRHRPAFLCSLLSGLWYRKHDCTLVLKFSGRFSSLCKLRRVRESGVGWVLENVWQLLLS